MKPPSDLRVLMAVLLTALLSIATSVACAEEKASDTKKEEGWVEVPPPPDEGARVVATPTPDLKPVGSLKTPKEASDRERKDMEYSVDRLERRAATVEEDQFAFFKSIESIVNKSGTRFNGRGWVLWTGDQAYGPAVIFPLSDRRFHGLLDLSVNGTVSKEVKWGGLFRFRGSLLPSTQVMNAGTDTIQVERLHLDLNPSFLSATLGDFEEAYTPLTLWNRDIRDVRFDPSFLRRAWDRERAWNFIDRGPAFPFRGARVGTDVMWPGSSMMDRFRISMFGHYLNNGFNTETNAYDGFSGALLGGSALLGFKGGVSLEAFGMLYEQPRWSDPGAAAYDPGVPSTWNRRVMTGSVRPRVETLMNGDVTLGASMEAAFSSYRPDAKDPDRESRDYALLGGPYVQWGKSRVQANFLNVGVQFYSPMAQLRERDDRTGAVLDHPILSSLPAVSDWFSFYDRLYDNTFPYGLATPNRQGFGLEADLSTLERDALKLGLSAYRVEEYTGYHVLDPTLTYLVPVDAPASPENPLRTFLYVNAGPRLNVAPWTGFSRDIELGFNVRMERTESVLGNLDTLNAAGSLRVEVLPGFTLEPGALMGSAKGREAFIDGRYARTPYRFDNRDLGSYTVSDVDTVNRGLGFSGSVRMSSQSHLSLDFLDERVEDRSSGQVWKQKQAEFAYEVEF